MTTKEQISQAEEAVTFEVADCVCPNCGATDVKDNTLPIDQWVWQIRPFKVHDKIEDGWWSECLVCKAAGRPAWFSQKDMAAAKNKH